MNERVGAFAIGAVCLLIGALAGATMGPSAHEAAAPRAALERERCFEDETLMWVDIAGKQSLRCVPLDNLPTR